MQPENTDSNNQSEIFDNTSVESDKNMEDKTDKDSGDKNTKHYFLGDLLRGNNLTNTNSFLKINPTEDSYLNLKSHHNKKSSNKALSKNDNNLSSHPSRFGNFVAAKNPNLIKPLIGEHNPFDNQNKERDLRERDIRIKGLEKFYKGREYWNWVLSFGIGVSILFQISIVFLLAYSDTTRVNLIEYKELLYIIAGENFIQIIGLALIAVKFYFADIKKESENRIP
jgi:hypothetical protein